MSPAPVWRAAAALSVCSPRSRLPCAAPHIGKPCWRQAGSCHPRLILLFFLFFFISLIKTRKAQRPRLAASPLHVQRCQAHAVRPAESAFLRLLTRGRPVQLPGPLQAGSGPLRPDRAFGKRRQWRCGLTRESFTFRPASPPPQRGVFKTRPWTIPEVSLHNNRDGFTGSFSGPY